MRKETTCIHHETTGASTVTGVDQHLQQIAFVARLRLEQAEPQVPVEDVLATSISGAALHSEPHVAVDL